MSGPRCQTLGVLGGGQLGRMLALAAAPLGVRCRFWDPAPDACAGDVGELVTAPFDDEAALSAFCDGLAAATLEFENVPVGLVEAVAERVETRPGPLALGHSQDRLTERTLFRELGIPTPPFVSVSSVDEVLSAADERDLPALLKIRRLGYDGKGQWLVSAPDDAEDAWHGLGGVPCILDGMIAFERELSIVAVRGADGGMVFYDLAENVHRGGILRESLAPAPASASAVRAARDAAAAIAERLGYVGVFAVEFFDVGGELLANEMAPRVHNTGHWTIDAAATSQFENHARAVLGLPLGSTAMTAASATMVNLIGEHPPRAELLADPTARVHLYGKRAKPGRKLGHVTRVER